MCRLGLLASQHAERVIDPQRDCRVPLRQLRFGQRDEQERGQQRAATPRRVGRLTFARGRLARRRSLPKTQSRHEHDPTVPPATMQPADDRQQRQPEQPQGSDPAQQLDRAWTRCRSSVCCQGCVMSQSLNATPLRAQKPCNRPVIAARSPVASAFAPSLARAGIRVTGFHVLEIEVARQREPGLGEIGHLHDVQCHAALENRAQGHGASHRRPGSR